MTDEERRAYALNAAIAYEQLKRNEVHRDEKQKISEAQLSINIDKNIKMFEKYIETGKIYFM